MMKKYNYYLIQANAILFLLGYYLMHSVLSVMIGEASRTASIVYDGLQLALCIYIIILCSKKTKKTKAERRNSYFSFITIVLVLFSLRMVYDVVNGPFVGVVPESQMWNDVILTVGSIFFPTWSLISSRQYIDLEKVSTGVFWLGFIVCILTFVLIGIRGAVFEDERLQLGGGLHTASLARIGAIETIVALHMFSNRNKHRLIYLLGLFVGVYITLASGSRGPVAGLVIAIGVYVVMALRKHKVLMTISIIVVIVFVINVEAILIWLSNYFPVISGRMLSTIVEGDESGREYYRLLAMQRILDNPILGYGYRLNADVTGYYPHNGILEVALCLGIPIGLLFTYFVYIKGTIKAVIMMVDRKFLFVSLMMVFSIVASIPGNSVLSGSFYFSIVMLGIAYLYYYKGSKQHVTELVR